MREKDWEDYARLLSETALKAVTRSFSVAELLEMEEKMSLAHSVLLREQPSHIYICLDYGPKGVPEKDR